jgi:hypothetical protein
MAQIDMAARLGSDGTHERHACRRRPDRLAQFMEGSDAVWAEMGQYAEVHP